MGLGCVGLTTVFQPFVPFQVDSWWQGREGDTDTFLVKRVMHWALLIDVFAQVGFLVNQ